jgi:cytochrome c551/c552
MVRFMLALLTMILAGLIYASGDLSAGDGEALFQSLKCGSCHKPDQKATAISLSEVAKAYQNEARLVGFFTGESPMIFESSKSGMMKGQMKHLTALSDGEKKALADYILSFK